LESRTKAESNIRGVTPLTRCFQYFTLKNLLF